MYCFWPGQTRYYRRREHHPGITPAEESTIRALALLNNAVKKGGLMASSRVGGLSGSFLPVSEDEGIAARIIADEMAIGVMNHKTTAVRVIPAPVTSFRN